MEITIADTPCPLCGKKSLQDMKGTFRFPPPANIPGGSIEVPGSSWQHCDACNEDILPPELDRALDRERYRRLGLLTPAEIRRVRRKTGLSAVELSRTLGVGEKTYTRWENGRSLQTRAMDTLIRLIDQNPEVFSALEAERGPEREAIVAGYFSQLEALKRGNPLAMAPHGGELSTGGARALRRCLLALRRK